MRRVVQFCLLVASCAPAAAQMYGPDYVKCRDRSTAGIVDCVNASAKGWDRRLNAAYQALLQRIDPGERDHLKAAQRLWIPYRDANCRFHASGRGTLTQIEGAECLRAMTQQRACELEAAGRQEGGAGAGCP